MYILSTIHLRCAIDTLYPCFDTFYFSRSRSPCVFCFFDDGRWCRRRWHCFCYFCSFFTFQSQDWDFHDKTLIAFYHFETEKKNTLPSCTYLSVRSFFSRSNPETNTRINTQTINSKSKLIDFNHDAKQFSVCLICYLYKYRIIIRLLKMISSINTRIDSGWANAVVKPNAMIFSLSLHPVYERALLFAFNVYKIGAI